MKKALLSILSMTAFAVAFFVVRYVLESYQERRALSEAEQHLKLIEKDGREEYPDLPASEATGRKAVESITEKLNAQTDTAKRKVTAAGNFYGFYFLNTRTRELFCRNLGIDISPFVEEFESVHVKELALSRKATSFSRSDEQDLYTKLFKQMNRTVERDMKDIATAENISTADVCRTMAENGQELAKDMHISRRLPAVFAVLNENAELVK